MHHIMRVVFVLLLAILLPNGAWAARGHQSFVAGYIESGETGLEGFRVLLVASYPGRKASSRILGSAVSDASGAFLIDYLTPGRRGAGSKPVLYVVAEKGPAMLAGVIGPGEATAPVVVNERTTVAVGYAFAQFIDGIAIEGNYYGVRNAVPMAANLAVSRTGRVSEILLREPNGIGTSTLATFNTLTNAVAACIDDDANCHALFDATTTPAGERPGGVLQSLANLVHNPSYPQDTHDPILALASKAPLYEPALRTRPTSWLLFLKITGGFYSLQDEDNLMNGPGNFAIDRKGFVWINNNYVPQPAGVDACAGERLIKLYPWGETVPGAPYFGGGLSGAGYGITLDPKGDVWVGNFGFEAPDCAADPDLAAAHDSVSRFGADGKPRSPPTGFTRGHIFWPQTTISDRSGNIWLANCGNDSVTRIPRGKPPRAFNIALPLGDLGVDEARPFGAALDLEGNLWVAGNVAEALWVIDPRGRVIKTIDGADADGNRVVFRPMGLASDSEGNVWVANSDRVFVPCPGPAVGNFGPGLNPSITMYDPHTREPLEGSPFRGGGLALPWGITVDGDDTIWVLNFGPDPFFDFETPGDLTNDTAISRFCGVETANCPVSSVTGDPISPSTGYTSDAFERLTAGQVDPSGNLWVTNNWKRADVDPANPGGNAVVVVIGAAGPMRTPLIGPVRSFDDPVIARGGRSRDACGSRKGRGDKGGAACKTDALGPR